MEHVAKTVFVTIYCFTMLFLLLTLGPIVILYSGWNGLTEVWRNVWATMSKFTNSKITGLISMVRYMWNM